MKGRKRKACPKPLHSEELVVTLHETLTKLHNRQPIDQVVTFSRSGIPQEAAEWALTNLVPHKVVADFKGKLRSWYNQEQARNCYYREGCTIVLLFCSQLQRGYGNRLGAEYVKRPPPGALLTFRKMAKLGAMCFQCMEMNDGRQEWTMLVDENTPHGITLETA